MRAEVRFWKETGRVPSEEDFEVLRAGVEAAAKAKAKAKKKRIASNQDDAGEDDEDKVEDIHGDAKKMDDVTKADIDDYHVQGHSVSSKLMRTRAAAKQS